MKKVLAILCLLLTSAAVLAQNTVTYQFDAAVHNGGAAGDPAGFIDGEGKLDVSGMAAGSLVCLDVAITDTNFKLAGFQFELNFPANLTGLSQDAAEWAAGTGATARVAGTTLAGIPIQGLPADGSGNLTATTLIQNRSGKMPIGELITDPAQRPDAGPMGSILKVCFILNPNNQPMCMSAEEDFVIPLSVVFDGPEDDIFASDTATRIVIGNTDLTAAFTNSNAQWQRADHSKTNGRNALDALPAARCALNSAGQSACAGWDANTANEYLQVFDYDCSGAVNALDALPLAKLCLGLQNRSSLKNVQSMGIDGSGTMAFSYEHQAAMAFAHIDLDGVKAETPYISAEASEAGWSLLHERSGGYMQYMLLNTSGYDMDLPTVRINYTAVAKASKIALGGTAHQNSNLEALDLMPQISMEEAGIDSDRPVKEDVLRK
jgi:hypothetical protein